MININLEVTGLEHLNILAGMQYRVSYAHRPFQKFWDYMRAQLLLTYYNSGNRGEARQWQPLKPETIKSKQRKGYAFPKHPLIATGTMSTNYYPFITSERIQINNDTPYLQYHEFGKGVPQRSSTFFLKDDLNYMSDLMLNYITEAKLTV